MELLAVFGELLMCFYSRKMGSNKAGSAVENKEGEGKRFCSLKHT